MSRRQLKRKASKADEPLPQEPRATYWERQIAPFLGKHARILVALLLLAGAARIVATFHVLSVTLDEPTHYAIGLEYWTDHSYRLSGEHPPLQHAMAALIPYLMGARSSPEIRKAPRVPELPLAIRLENIEEQTQLPPDARTEQTVVRMRWGVLPFFLVAGLVVYEWTRSSFGKPAAVVATALFTLIPTVLAHAGLATTDIALTACLAAAFLSLIRWAEAPGAKRALLLGFWAALAVLSKFTTLLYLPAAAVFALAGFLMSERPGTARLLELARSRISTFALAAVTAAILIWGGYWFSFDTAPWSGGMRLPAPELFNGLRAALSHNQSGHMAYLLGQSSLRGFWYFFPVALAVKTPLAVLLLAGLGLAVCWKQGLWKAWPAIAFACGVLAPAMAGHINIGVRHVLPVYVSFSMLGAVGWIALAGAARRRNWGLVAAGTLTAWLACAGIFQHPDYLSYFNELAGRRPERIIADSDMDWGQSAKRVGARLRELGATEVSVYVSDKFERDLYTGRLYGYPPLKPFQSFVPNPGWNVISPTSVAVMDGGWDVSQTVQYGGRTFQLRPWYQSMEPTERVGSLLLYYVPPQAVPASFSPRR
jgi:4-amino-4-deoxy-L-arabinose transferase-like glycosyltransferase